MRTSSTKVLFLYLLILTFNLPCVIFAQCTGGMALGFPAGDRNIIGATLDWGGPATLSMLKAKFVTDGKYRYLRKNFDNETYKQSIEIESQVAVLAAEGKESEARQLLTDFLDKRMNDAIVIAENLITKWSK